MSGSFLGLLIESLVAVLLVLTIGYCMILNRRLARLRANESNMRATIAELAAATERAERATGGLRATVQECDQTLGERLRTAERYTADLDDQLEHAQEVLSRIIRIAGAADEASRPAREARIEAARAHREAGLRPSPAVNTAQAIANRLRTRPENAA